MPSHTIIDNLNAYRPHRASSPTCNLPCVGGRACCLNSRIPHQLHKCANPDCACHQTYRDFLDRKALELASGDHPA